MPFKSKELLFHSSFLPIYLYNLVEQKMPEKSFSFCLQLGEDDFRNPKVNTYNPCPF